MRKRKPRHSKQNVVIRMGKYTPRTRVITRERYTDMCNEFKSWREWTELVCIIPYPSPELFNKES